MHASCVPYKDYFAQEMAKAAVVPYFEAQAEANEEERAERLAIAADEEAQPSSEQTWVETVVNALFKNEKKRSSGKPGGAEVGCRPGAMCQPSPPRR